MGCNIAGNAQLDAAEHAAERVAAGAGTGAERTSNSERAAAGEELRGHLGAIAHVAAAAIAQQRVGELVVAADATVAGLHHDQHGDARVGR